MLAQNEYKLNEAAALKPKTSFLGEVESVRRQATIGLNKKRRGALGQFFTPLVVAQIMSAMPDLKRERIRVLDAGAGAGVLTAALVASVCERKVKPKEINVVAIELDSSLVPYLHNTLEKCQAECERNDITFTFRIYNEDFLNFAVNNLPGNLFAAPDDFKFDLAILNPPYGKLNAGSEASSLLRRHGIITPNLYTSFLALCAEMLAPDGELVAITPRSFCNGTYFKPFRQYFLERMSFLRFHVFDSRKDIFDEDILQENIIFHAVKNKFEQFKNNDVIISTSRSGVESNGKDSIKLKNEEIVRPGDKDLFIHLGGKESEQITIGRTGQFQSSLEDLGLQVSTGKVVDFRAKEFLQNGLSTDAVPLVYPHNLQKGIVHYPLIHKKKFDSIRVAPETESLLVVTGTYVLVKRFSAKEEKKRITASLFELENAPGEKIGFENHLNYFHANGQGIDSKLAKGLTVYLNSSLLDAYFRRFSGHTQVNATDLRYLKYPTCVELETLGAHFTETISSQEKTDSLIERILL